MGEEDVRDIKEWVRNGVPERDSGVASSPEREEEKEICFTFHRRKKKREKKITFVLCRIKRGKIVWRRHIFEWGKTDSEEAPERDRAARNEEEKEPHSLSCVATERTGRRKVSAECESSKDGESASNSRGNLQALPGRGSIGSTGSLNRLIRSLAPFFGPPLLFLCVCAYIFHESICSV